MSIDYDRLRELRDECTTGQRQSHIYEPDPYCYPGATRFVIAADWDKVEIAEGHAGPSTKSSEYARKASDFALMALAPDMARELLRLHDEGENLLAQMADHVAFLRDWEQHNLAYHVEQYTHLLARLLTGDTNEH